MKRILSVFAVLSLLAFSAWADEREDLLKELADVEQAKWKVLNDAEKQLDMNFAASDLLDAVKPFLYRAAEYRLRRLATPEERVALLRDLSEIQDSVRTMFLEPREGRGSAYSMLLACSATSSYSRLARIWLMPDPEYADWCRWANVKIELPGRTVPLRNGEGSYTVPGDEEELTYELLLPTQYRFVHGGKRYAIVWEDFRDSMSCEAKRHHLCRLDPDGVLRIVRTMKELWLEADGSMSIEGETLVFRSKSCVTATIPLPE